MKEVTISFTSEEYRELAKLVTLGLTVTCSQDDYEHHELAEKVMVKVCKCGFEQIPESGAFMKENVDTLFDLPFPEFVISNELHEECEELENDHVEMESPEYFVIWLAHRDFTEKYGKMDEDEIIANNEYLSFVMDRQTDYRQEFLFNGVANMRLEKKRITNVIQVPDLTSFNHAGKLLPC